MDAIDIPQAHVVNDRTISKVSYTPMTELDYGTLLCWGTNDQGTQLEPCVYHIVTASKYRCLRLHIKHSRRREKPSRPENRFIAIAS